MTREEEIKQAAYWHDTESTKYEQEYFIDGANWADENPKSQWHKVSDSLPPENPKDPTQSVEVFVTSGTFIDTAQYDFQRSMWIGTILQHITHWMLPELPKEE